MIGFSTPVLWVAALVGLMLSLTGLSLMKPASRTMRLSGSGIVDFELALTRSRSQRVLHQWGEPGTTAAVESMPFDVVFLIGYGTLLSAVALLVQHRIGVIVSPPAATLTRRIAAGAACAAGLDLLEDISLLLLIDRWREKQSVGPWPWIAGIAARVKFALAGC